MGSNGSKQTKRKQIPKSNFEYEPSYELSERHHHHHHHHLQNPHNDQPIRLSWLQQNNTNDDQNRIADRHHHHHHHHHHHAHKNENIDRLPLAINRWPKENVQVKDQKPKSFIEEYVHQ